MKTLTSQEQELVRWYRNSIKYSSMKKRHAAFKGEVFIVERETKNIETLEQELHKLLGE